jgi:hypothetical protein
MVDLDKTFKPGDAVMIKLNKLHGEVDAVWWDGAETRFQIKYVNNQGTIISQWCRPDEIEAVA